MSESKPNFLRFTVTALFMTVIGLSVAIGTSPLWEPMARHSLGESCE